MTDHPHAANGQVRILTWNILHERYGYQERVREIAAQILASGAQVVLLQEASRGATYDAASDVAALVGMTVAASALTIDFSYGDRFRDEHQSRAAILTNLGVHAGGPVPLLGRVVPEVPVAEIVLPSGRVLVAVSVHLRWGGDQEAERLQQVARIDAIVRARMERLALSGHSDAVAVLGGDLNALPDSDTMRYLRGLGVVDGASTLWVDAWAATRPDEGYTVVSGNPLARQVALGVGIGNPDRLPPRRIDYIMARGWVYGRPNDPLATRLIGERPLTGVVGSDHWGVLAEVSDPPRS